VTLACAGLSASAPSHFDVSNPSLTTTSASVRKPVLGQTAFVTEIESGLAFLARVDTGAASCSIHAEEIRIVEASDDLHANVGKTVCFRITDRDGQSKWLQRPINKVKKIKNPNGTEHRYLVTLNFFCQGQVREVLVSLNDRSTMNYSLLLGRNFLTGNFMVDVAHGL
jgi:hypothetical protein